MTSCMRRSIGDTDPIQWIIREKLIDEDRSRPVSLVGKTVYVTMVDSNIERLLVEPVYTFGSEGDRDQYFVGNPEELIDGLVVQTVDPVECIIRQFRYRNGEWKTDVTTVIEDKECTITDAGKGYVSYAPTTKEVYRAGMYQIYFRVISPVGDSDDTYEVRYPRGESLWIHIMDIFNDC